MRDELKDVPLAILLVLFILCILMGNCMVILAVCYERKLRVACNLYLISLSISDLLIGILVVPLSSIYEIKHRWILGSIGCRLWLATDMLCCTASIFNLCVISMDRWRAISRPMSYPQFSTSRRAIINIIILWVVSAAISTPVLFGWGQSKLSQDECGLDKDPAFIIYSSGLSFFLPLAVMTFFYSCIYMIATRHKIEIKRGSSVIWSYDSEYERSIRESMDPSKKISRYKSITTSRSSLDNLSPRLTWRQTRPVRTGLHNPSTILANKNTIAHQLKRLGHHTKAAKTLGIIIGAFVFCWGPFFVLFFLSGVCANQCGISDVWRKISFWIGYCNSMVNPIIYPCLNRDFRKAFQNILHRFYCRKNNLDYWYKDRFHRGQRTRAGRDRFFPSSVGNTSTESSQEIRSHDHSISSRSIMSSRSSFYRRSRKFSIANRKESAFLDHDDFLIASDRSSNQSRLLSLRSSSSRTTTSSLQSTDTSMSISDDCKMELELAQGETMCKKNETKRKSFPDLLERIEIKLFHKYKHDDAKGFRRFSLSTAPKPPTSEKRRSSAIAECDQRGMVDPNVDTKKTDLEERSIYTIEENSRRESGSSQGSRSINSKSSSMGTSPYIRQRSLSLAVPTKYSNQASFRSSLKNDLDRNYIDGEFVSIKNKDTTDSSSKNETVIIVDSCTQTDDVRLN